MSTKGQEYDCKNKENEELTKKMTNFTQDYSIYNHYPVCYNYCVTRANKFDLKFILGTVTEQGAAK